MNEKIKQLHIEATEWALYNYPPPVNPFEWEDMRSKKFAELIIKQCGYYADIFNAAGCPVDMDPVETKPSDYIKQHFEIK